jgi:hypothetical protein
MPRFVRLRTDRPFGRAYRFQSRTGAASDFKRLRKQRRREMTPRLIGLSECVAISGLDWKEVVVGVEPSSLHNRLLRSFLQDRPNNSVTMSRDIVAKIRAAIDFGENKEAADLLIVLRRLLAARARLEKMGAPAMRRRGFARSSQWRRPLGRVWHASRLRLQPLGKPIG